MATSHGRTSGGVSSRLGAVLLLALLALLALAAGCTTTPNDSDTTTPTDDSADAPMGGRVEWLTTLPVNGADQSVEVRGDDAHTIRQLVLDHLGAEPQRAVYVMGHSMGTMIGLDLVHSHPDRYAGFIGVGQVTDVVANEQGSHAFALAQARPPGTPARRAS